MATWNSNGLDVGGSGSYVSGTQSVQFIHDNFAANGDTITLPTGTFGWATGVLLSKTLSILGSGYTANNTTGGSTPGAPNLFTTIYSTVGGSGWAIGWNFSSTGTFTNRISGIHFTGLGNSLTGSSTQNGGLTNGSAIVTGLTTSGLNTTMFVTGNGIPISTTIASIDSSSQIHLSNNFYGTTGTQQLFFGTTGSPTAVTYCDLAGANSVTGSSNTDAYRVDNCIFDGGNFQVIMMRLEGNPIGCVVDHCTFVGGDSSEMIHNTPLAAGNTGGWKDDIVPGSNKLLYFEDCLFEFFNWTTRTTIGTSAMESFYGARNSIRYSTFHQCQIDQHGTQGSVGSRWWEFYNLTFVESAAAITANTGISCFAMRGGSGFIYNITVNPSNANSGKCYCVIYSDDPSPCPYGPGNGIFVGGNAQVPDDSSPVYLWNVDSKMNIGTQNGHSGANDIAANRNFFVSSPQQGSTQPTNILLYQAASGAVTNYAYTSFTYPHPLTAIASVSPVLSGTMSLTGQVISTLIPPGSGLTADADARITRTVLGVTSSNYVTPTNNYVALYSHRFNGLAKAGANEWLTSSNPAYARQAMGSPASSWTIAAYASGTGVLFNNTNTITQPAVTSNDQVLFSFAWCDALTGGNINLFIDLAASLPVPQGISVVLPAGTGAVFTTY